MKDIQGRIIDFILMKDGSHISPHTVMSRVRGIDGVENFKLTQKRDSSIELQVRTRTEKSEEALRTLRHRCLELFGEVPLNIDLVDEIEGERGPKFRPVESHLTQVSGS